MRPRLGGKYRGVETVENFYRRFIGAKLTSCAGERAPKCPRECQFCRFFCVFEVKEGTRGRLRGGGKKQGGDGYRMAKTVL